MTLVKKYDDFRDILDLTVQTKSGSSYNGAKPPDPNPFPWYTSVYCTARRAMNSRREFIFHADTAVLLSNIT